MIIIFWITIIIISIYLVYPVWLMVLPVVSKKREPEYENIDAVSLILLTYNGKAYLQKKIDFLLQELACFKQSELIIVDDNSADGTREILARYKNNPKVKIILKKEQRGIPHSMNMAIGFAGFEHIIFCDQRQVVCPDILKRILEPLKYENVGAVSGCISHHDKGMGCSYIRKFENFIKLLESSTGCLIGVYGPFYAIKRKCYIKIPEHIILDDLYLSLRILKSKQVVLIKDCTIIDNNFSSLYNYKRARRYLVGFMQLFYERGLIRDLNRKQIMMLLWHKYLRLFIPVLLFCSYIMSGFLMQRGFEYQVLFGILTLMGLVTILQMVLNFKSRLFNIFRMNMYYIAAMVEISAQKIFKGLLLNRKGKQLEVKAIKDVG